MNDWEMTKALVAASAERFASETAGHKMTALHDDGSYRHLRFQDPKNPFYWFDLITTPWMLVFRGDGESFVFTATEDMLGWFRRSSQGAGDSTHIQPDHWSSKLTSDRDSVKEFSQERFDMEAAEYLEQVEVDFPGVTAAWVEFTTGATAEHSTEYKETAQWAVSNFEFGEEEVNAWCSCGAATEPTSFTQAAAWSARHERDNDSTHELAKQYIQPFRFEGTEEWLTHDFGWWFLWACHAIVWGIRRYDDAKAEQAAQVVRAVPAGVRELVGDLISCSGLGESCWIVPTPTHWALLVPREGGGLPYFAPSRQRRTIDDAVSLGLVRLGDALEPLPAHAGAPTWLVRSVPQPLEGYRITALGGVK